MAVKQHLKLRITLRAFEQLKNSSTFKMTEDNSS